MRQNLPLAHITNELGPWLRCLLMEHLPIAAEKRHETLSLKIALLPRLLRWVALSPRHFRTPRGAGERIPLASPGLMTGWHRYFDLDDTNALHFASGIVRMVARVITLLDKVWRVGSGQSV